MYWYITCEVTPKYLCHFAVVKHAHYLRNKDQCNQIQYTGQRKQYTSNLSVPHACGNGVNLPIIAAFLTTAYVRST